MAANGSGCRSEAFGDACVASVMACMVDTYVGSVIRPPVSGPWCTPSPFKNLRMDREAQR